jgi:hypothetical protein
MVKNVRFCLAGMCHGQKSQIEHAQNVSWSKRPFHASQNVLHLVKIHSQPGWNVSIFLDLARLA